SGSAPTRRSPVTPRANPASVASCSRWRSWPQRACRSTSPGCSAAAGSPPPSRSHPGRAGSLTATRSGTRRAASCRAACTRPATRSVAPRTAESVLDVILGIVGQRTGYPREMLGAEMDLEADLSIDSIKRTEIIMELAEHLRLSRAGVPVAEGIVEQLARLKTIGAIVVWVVEH